LSVITVNRTVVMLTFSQCVTGHTRLLISRSTLTKASRRFGHINSKLMKKRNTFYATVSRQTGDRSVMVDTSSSGFRMQSSDVVAVDALYLSVNITCKLDRHFFQVKLTET